MRESRPYGSVRGVLREEHPYRDEHIIMTGIASQSPLDRGSLLIPPTGKLR